MLYSETIWVIFKTLWKIYFHACKAFVMTWTSTVSSRLDYCSISPFWKDSICSATLDKKREIDKIISKQPTPPLFTRLMIGHNLIPPPKCKREIATTECEIVLDEFLKWLCYTFILFSKNVSIWTKKNPQNRLDGASFKYIIEKHKNPLRAKRATLFEYV